MTVRTSALFLELLLGGCAVTPPPSPPPPAPPALSAPAASPSLTLVQHYDAAKRRVLAVVVLPTITVAQIERIRAADHSARAALNRLGRTHTRAALEAARAAVIALEAALTLDDPDHDAPATNATAGPSGLGPARQCRKPGSQRGDLADGRDGDPRRTGPACS